MARRKKLMHESRVLLPWETESSFRRFIFRYRVRTVLGVIALMLGLGALVVSERHRAGVRQTRAVVERTGQVVDRFMAEHGRCPKDLGELSQYGQLREMPQDAWGEPLQLHCPSVDTGARYELVSGTLFVNTLGKEDYQ